MDECAPNIQNILDQTSLKWIYVSGKGGVGKTTSSCSLAVQLSKVRKNVLIISTDPAHNTSDAFSQKFGKQPQKVNGFENLFCMEIDASGAMDDAGADATKLPNLGVDDNQIWDISKKLLGEVSGSLPGIDEAMAFAQIFKLIDSLEFDCVVFDTAPTGHTLRLLSFPAVLEKTFGKLIEMFSSFKPMLGMLGGMMGGGQSLNPDEIFDKLSELLMTVKKIKNEFCNPEKTTFVCVAIAEFLSLYETERLIQALMAQNIDTHNIIVNQLLFPEVDEDGKIKCGKCNARYKIQQKYLAQITDLYEDFHIIKLPLLETEIRGPKALLQFGERLINQNTQQ
uniref:ATPase ASNA1 homolog n=1 Tax=Rhabditophanes sp. KR3021 TaxID=114890 RepID=A0AC35TJ81_9BILA